MWNEYKKTVVFAVPMVLGNLSHMLYGIVDSIMVGHLGAVPLAASAFVNSVIGFPTIFLIGLASAVSVLIAQAVGRKAFDDCGVYLVNAFWSLTTVAVIISLGLFLLAPFLDVFGQDAEVLNTSYGYFLYMTSSLPFLTTMMAFRKYSEGLSYTYEPLIFFSFGIALNILFNWIFIFGHFGVPQMGLTGAGLGTLLSRIIMAVGFAIYIYRSKKFSASREGLWVKYLNKRHLKNLLSLGLPSGFQHLFEVGVFGSAAILMGWFGAKELAGHQIAMNVASTTFMIPLGLSFGISVRIAQAYGEKNHKAVRTIGWGGVGFSLIIMSALAVIIVLTRHWIPKFYINDLEVLSWAAQFLMVAAIFQLFDGAQAILVGVLRGLSDVKWPTFLTLIAYWGLGLPACYLMGFHTSLGPVGIWLGLGGCLVVAALFLSIRFYIHTHNVKKISL